MTILALAASPARANGLGAAKPSDLVTLAENLNDVRSCTSGGKALDVRHLGNGTFVDPFGIPEGKTLMVTSAEVSFIADAPVITTFDRLAIENQETGTQSLVTYFAALPVLDGNVGLASRSPLHLTFPSGIAVEAGSRLCGAGGFWVVHGYLTKAQ